MRSVGSGVGAKLAGSLAAPESVNRWLIFRVLHSSGLLHMT